MRTYRPRWWCRSVRPGQRAPAGPRAGRSCTVLIRWARLRPGGGRASRRRARRPSAERASSCRVPAGRTGNHPLRKRGRSRSACVVNERLGHEGAGVFQASERVISDGAPSHAICNARAPAQRPDRAAHCRGSRSCLAGHPSGRRCLRGGSHRLPDRRRRGRPPCACAQRHLGDCPVRC